MTTEMIVAMYLVLMLLVVLIVLMGRRVHQALKEEREIEMRATHGPLGKVYPLTFKNGKRVDG